MWCIVAVNFGPAKISSFGAVVKLSSLRSVKILVYRMGMGIAVFSLLAGMSSLLVSQTNPTSKTSQNRKQVPANSSTEILGNEDVVQMMRNKLNINVILNAIRDSQGHYSVTPSSLIRLNAAGVPAAVIEAMQAKAAAASTKITGIAAASGCSYLSEWVTT